MFDMLSLLSLDYVINEMNKVDKKKMIDIKSYQEGFMDGIGYKNDYKIRLLGYDLTELLKIVDSYSTKEPKMPTKAKMTRAEAIACLDKHNPHNYNTSHMIDFYIEAGMLEIVEEKRKPIEWGEPLHLITSHGTYKAKYIGKDSKGKRIVDIEDYTKLQVYCNPNDDGYIIEYDRWLENY